MENNQTLETKAEVKNGVKRLIFAGIAIILQVLVILLISLRFAEQAEWFAIGTRVLGTLLVLLHLLLQLGGHLEVGGGVEGFVIFLDLVDVLFQLLELLVELLLFLLQGLVVLALGLLGFT